MTAARSVVRRDVALALAAGLTTWVTMLSWRGFSERSSRYLVPLLLAALLLAGTGSVLRALKLPRVMVLAGQTLIGAGFTSVALTGSLLPVGEHWDDLLAAIAAAGESTRTYAAPVPEEVASIHPLMLPFGVVCLLLVDLLACTLRRVPLAGLPLLTIYAVAVSLLRGEVSWVLFALSAGGFLTMLFLQEDEHISRWGRAVGRADAGDPAAFGVRTGAVRTSALGLGGAATALAVLAPALVPTLHLGVFGNGPGGRGGKVTVDNPMVDLRRDLRRGDDVPLLRVTTRDPDPTYLRISVLTRYSGDEWTAGDRVIPATQSARGEMPALAGVTSAVERTAYDYRVAVNVNFDSRWLPVRPSLTSILAPGDWRYDVSTMDFIAADDDTNAAGLVYEMTGVRLDLHAAQLDSAPRAAGTIADRFTALPDDLPPRVRELAAKITAAQPTSYQKAVALQAWFRRDGGFRYDLSTAPTGNGNSALLDFLDDRVGYCEQFASAMAVMARTLGIPARVAVGFLAPDETTENVYEFSAYDLHAWPELYFPGAGWVRFEPTPGGRDGSAAPSYTREPLPRDPTDAPSASVTAVPSDEVIPRPSGSAAPDTTQPESDSGGLSSALPWRWVLPGLAGLVLAAVAALLPSWVRRWRRRRRFDGTAHPVESAWDELRDTVTDLVGRWPHGLSPRAAAARVGELFGDPDEAHPAERPPRGPDQAPEAMASLDLLVRAVERTRYARAGSAPEVPAAVLRAAVETCARALEAGATRRARQRARWWPASVLTRRPVRGPGATATVEVVGYGGVVDHVG